MPDTNIHISSEEYSDSLRVLFDSLPLPATFWQDDRITYCNQEAVDLFGCPDQHYLMDNFSSFSPERQPDGSLSMDTIPRKIQEALREGWLKFEWIHQKQNGELIPTETTLVRISFDGNPALMSYIRDLREEKRILADMREADDRAQIMLDATPLCCNFWDESMNNIDCNQEAVRLFDLNNKQEYLDRFSELSPKYQPDGRLSSEKSIEMVKTAFDKGRVVFEWMHQKLNGDPVPAEITLVRTQQGEKTIVAGYTRDLREEKRMLAGMREADERTQIMLDATPLCCNLWNEDMNNIDCNQEAVNLFDLRDKKEYLDRFSELSPKYQPDGRLSSEKSIEMVKAAFNKGRVVFEWMHQKLNGDPVPAEITLVRVERGDHFIVAGYTRDLRELKKTVDRLNQLESLAFTDSGTGVYNRHYFMTRAEQSFGLNDPTETPLAVIMMDLDKFKNINDTHGHLAGDEVLKAVALTAQSVLRSGDLLARYGGEEFIIMIKHTELAVVRTLAERIRTTISELEIPYDGKILRITVSLGIAIRQNNHESVTQIIARADENLYTAKDKGRNRVEP